MTSRLGLPAVLVFAAMLGLEPREADACGGAFWSVEETTISNAIDAQRTLLVYDGTTVRHFVQVAYAGNPKEFAWVYPLPENPEPLEEVEDGEALFRQLDELTRPVFHIQVIGAGGDDSGGGCSGGCIGMGAASAGGDDYQTRDGGSDSGVVVWGGGRVGVFDYAVITAETIEPMQAWLVDNGFRVPDEALPVLQHYVENNFYFVSMKINPEASSVTGEAATSTILFRYPETRRVYPLHMASIGAAPATKVVLYVLAAHRATATPYPTVQIDRGDLVVEGTDPHFTVNYEEVFAHALDAAGGAAFVTEFAGTVGDPRWWSASLADLPTSPSMILTRLRTTMDGARMRNDVELADARNDTVVSREFSFTVRVAARSSGGSPDILLALSVPALIALFARRRATRPS